MKLKRIIYLLLTLIMAIVIFMFSSQSSKESNNLSYRIDIVIFKLISKKTESTSANVASTENQSNNESKNSITKKNIESSSSKTTLSKKKSEYPVNNKTFHDIDFIVRKTAHVTLYAIFATFLTLFFKTYNIKTWKAILLVVLIAFAYACLDEYNQKLRGTRTGIFTDSLIDTVGCFIGIIIVLVKERIKEKSIRKLEVANLDPKF